MLLKCRFCQSGLDISLVDLGYSPLANSYLQENELAQGETYYPLHAYVCRSCLLVQLPAVIKPTELFSEYSYFSSFSDSWLSHCQEYTHQILNRFGRNQPLSPSRLVIEIGSNDGSLLQFFIKSGLRVTGIEPAKNVAKVASARGIPTINDFFDSTVAGKLREEGSSAHLLIANNVLAHVPNLNDFLKGVRTVLAPDGIFTAEFPHLLNLIKDLQFDTIYHEHFSYFSLTTLRRILQAHELQVFDSETIPTHGGSLRIYVCHAGNQNVPVHANVNAVIEAEERFGLHDLSGYRTFASEVKRTKFHILKTITSLKQNKKRIICYGAAAKGNTLLNYCGIGRDFIDYAVDRSPHKQGRFLPGTRLHIHSPEIIRNSKPDIVWILPWNVRDEIMEQLEYIKEWDGRFLVNTPEFMVL